MEKLVGLFVIGITALLLATVVLLGRGKDWFAEEVTFYTEFKESYNLQVNAAVKLFRADIGKVKEISLGEDNVKVKLAILAKYASRIREDAVAVVDSPTLIGSEYISIIPGRSRSPIIPDGGTIPSKEKKSVSDILKDFEVEKTARLVVQAIQDITELVANLKDPDGPLMGTVKSLEATAQHLAQVTGDIQRGEGTVGSLIASRELVDTVMSNLNQVGPAIEDLRRTTAKGPEVMDRVNENLETIRTAGVGVVESVERLKMILEKTQKSLDTIQAVLLNVKEGSEDIPRLTSTTRDGIQEIRDEIAEVDRIVQSLQKNFLIRGNLPQPPETFDTDAGIRP